MFDWLFENAPWTPELSFSSRAAHVTIATCCLAIPCWIAILYRLRRRDIPSSWFLLLFAALFFLFAACRALNAAAFYWTPNRLFVIFDWVVASVSVSTLVAFPFVIRALQEFPSLAEFARKVEELQSERLVTEQLIKDLHARDLQKVKEIRERDDLIRNLRHEIRDSVSPVVHQREIIQRLQAQLEEIRRVGRGVDDG